MVKRYLKRIGLALMTLLLVQTIVLAQSETGSTSETEPDNVTEASFKSRCDQAEDMGFPECADSPNECASELKPTTAKDKNGDIIKQHRTPLNCLFLEEPIGGKPGYDLYKVTPTVDQGLEYSLWYGEAIVGNTYGPVQALLTFEVGKELQGPFGLLYNYLGLVYNFISGVIVGFAVLIVIIGGVLISTAGGEPDKLSQGKDLIKKALVGMILWFTASVILYTINPTFFTF